ncbi:MAG TPA: lysophospholipid acyltransferase family protein [Spongiibacteraceae bacterium]|nr:lysophospholipid acyltransferase family protein [Spongiibacteraceae bacterium]
MKAIRTLWLGSRAAIFYFGYTLMLIGICTTAVIFLRKAPFSTRYAYLTSWNRAVLHWLRWTCGLSVRISGRENLPEGPFVLLAKHQSPWETLILQILHPPVITVLKKELISVPFFGWGMSMLEPICIDRSNPKQALRAVMDQGQEQLARGRSIMMFPEGTRTPVGQVGNYARSGATLACKAGVPIVPVAHNAGRYWPSKKFIKYPGVIQMVIGAPIDTTGRDGKELTEILKNWIEGEIVRMDADAHY